MQYLSPPISFGPSLNTWPRWAPQDLQVTSVLVMPWELSTCSVTDPPLALAKAGQPHPESNFQPDSKSGVSHTIHMQLPASQCLLYSPVQGRSVPFSWVTWYQIGVSLCFSSSLVNVFSILILLENKQRLLLKGRSSFLFIVFRNRNIDFLFLD